jgi:SAM-dependent methyltransferase
MIPRVKKRDFQNLVFRNKAKIVLARMKILRIYDFGRFVFRFLKNHKKNRHFVQNHPEYIPPPDYIQYETTGSVDDEYFFLSGKSTAQFVSQLIRRQLKTENARVLDWGCGVARVLRHMPEFLPGATLFGSDYNPKAIRSNQTNFRNMTFVENRLLPPIAFEGGYFDCIYCISVFTHLSESVIQSWLQELNRIAKVGGIVVLTLHGESYRRELLPAEREALETNGTVFRNDFQEGKKWFTSYHNPKGLKKDYFSNFEIIDHIVDPPVLGFHQDFYILKKLAGTDRNQKSLTPSADS